MTLLDTLPWKKAQLAIARKDGPLSGWLGANVRASPAAGCLDVTEEQVERQGLGFRDYDLGFMPCLTGCSGRLAAPSKSGRR